MGVGLKSRGGAYGVFVLESDVEEEEVEVEEEREEELEEKDWVEERLLEVVVEEGGEGCWGFVDL